MSPSPFVVSIAGLLMVLAKRDLLHLLKALHGCVHFAPSVYDEVVTRGIREDYEDARALSLFFSNRFIGPLTVGSCTRSRLTRISHASTVGSGTL